jgi:cytochrome oxidase Cu insertion factor (SCO1/SenC/PrrC family)
VTELSAQDRRQRKILIGVALMFFAPLAFAFYLYYGGVHWRPGHRVNAGELIQPARPLSEKFLTGKWTLLYVQQGRCEAECQRHLYDTRQVRTALDREMTRVQRVFVGDADCCDLNALHDLHPDLIVKTPGADDAAWLALLQIGEGANERDRTYVIDPLGNLMMYYPPDAKPKGMLEDMKRLLRLSSIG